jgi:hypothetical protein
MIVAHVDSKILNSKKGKAVPLEAWSGPRGFQEVKVPRFHDNGTG